MSELQTRKWQTLQRATLRHHQQAGTPCTLCGHPIDYTLPLLNSDGSYNPGAPSIDHTTPRHHGGSTWDADNLQPAHHYCNSRKQDRTPAAQRNHSRDWTRQ